MSLLSKKPEEQKEGKEPKKLVSMTNLKLAGVLLLLFLFGVAIQDPLVFLAIFWIIPTVFVILRGKKKTPNKLKKLLSTIVLWFVLLMLTMGLTEVTIDIEKPEEGSVFGSSVALEGYVEPTDLLVRINGKRVLTDKNGKFTAEIGLEEGENKIYIVAYNFWRRGTKDILIKRELTEEEKIKKAQEEERLKVEAERGQQEAEARRKSEEETKRQAEEEAKRKAEEEDAKRQAEEAQRQAEEKAKREAERIEKERDFEEKKIKLATQYCEERKDTERYYITGVIEENNKEILHTDESKKGSNLTLDDCKEIVDFLLRFRKEEVTKISEDTKDIIEGMGRVGMSKTELLISYGVPNDINTTVLLWRTSEQWVYYKDMYGFSAIYVYLDNNKVTSYQDF